MRDLTNPEVEGGRDINPFAVRMALISGQYRKPYNFTNQKLKDSTKHIERFIRIEQLAQESLKSGSAGPDEFGEILDACYQRTLHAMLDDLNTPLAFASAIEGAKGVEKATSLSQASAKSVQEWLDKTNALLGLFKYDNGYAPASGGSTEEVDPAERFKPLLEARQAARNARDYARADEIRDEIESMGYEIIDTPEGPKVKKKVNI